MIILLILINTLSYASETNPPAITIVDNNNCVTTILPNSNTYVTVCPDDSVKIDNSSRSKHPKVK